MQKKEVAAGRRGCEGATRNKLAGKASDVQVDAALCGGTCREKVRLKDDEVARSTTEQEEEAKPADKDKQEP